MARIRNRSATGSAANSRKRSRGSLSPVRSPKRRHQDSSDSDYDPSNGRERSPAKTVHWGRGSRIISGPTIIDPERRPQSPARSALRAISRGDDHVHGYDSACDCFGPDSQLEKELTTATPSPAKRSAAKRPYDSKSLGASDVAQNGSGKNSYVEARSVASLSEDVNVCKQLDELKDLVANFAEAFPSRPKKVRSDVLSHIIQPQNEQLVRYVGCIAMGGDNSAEGWQEVLMDDSGRRAVVWGVLGKALKENMFDALYFGAWPELESKLRRMEQEQARQDGFYRQRNRSDEIVKQEAGKSRATKDNIFTRAAVRITIALESLLLPLWELGEKTEGSWRTSEMHNKLFKIVATAGEVTRTMRRARDVIYYWHPTLKDEEFEPARMESLNLNEMIRESPYDRQTIKGRERPILRVAYDSQSQAIVRIVCFPGVQAFRQGGGELAKRELATESTDRDVDDANAPPDVLAVRRHITNRYGEEYTGNEGFRTRVISKGVVLLKWAQQCLLTKEAGTSIHIDAVQSGKMDWYLRDSEGHVELFKLFQERMSSARSSPVKLASPQRSPSLVERVTKFVWSQPPVREDSPPIANFNELYSKIQDVGQPARVAMGAKPKGRKLNRK